MKVARFALGADEFDNEGSGRRRHFDRHFVLGAQQHQNVVALLVLLSINENL